MKKLTLKLLGIALLLAATINTGASASPSGTSNAATAWRLLDYIAVDYAGAVSEGTIINAAEYDEMVEFSQSVGERIATLPRNAARSNLEGQAERLARAVSEKEPADKVGQLARALSRDLLRAYPVPLAPAAVPDLSRAVSLYGQKCAACHGSGGSGDGPSAAGMDPAPIAFTDLSRARERSVFSLYQVINQGIDGTAMASFAQLDVADQWALAFRVGTFAFSKDDARRGEAMWRAEPDLRRRFPDLETLTQITPANLAVEIGEDRARALVAFLRRAPEEVIVEPTDGLDTARARLRESMLAYGAGDRDKAADLALSAYLDGFEPLEPVLAGRDAQLLAKIERSMGELRAAIGRGEPPSNVQRRADQLRALFDEADGVLAQESGGWLSSFVGALTILLREGLEALLIVVAMVGFLRKADQPKSIRYVHAGWIAALIGGVGTWFAATRLIAVSGASRELTEGFGSLFAALVLVSVGIWMHGKSQAGEWQRYIHKTMGQALSRGSGWFLFGLAFLVVYREVFETILFYTALWTERNGGAILAGASTAIALLGVIAWAMLRYSRKLPVGKLFSYSSGLIAVLAVVLIGKGVAGLQEAGLVGISPWPLVPRVKMLGVFPAAQPLIAQIVLIGMIALGFWSNTRKARLLPHKSQGKHP